MFCALVCGTLTANPARREGSKASFATAVVRVQPQQGEAFLASIIGFGERADELLRLAKGTAISVAGRANFNTWTGRDGTERHGLNLVADTIAALAPQRPRAAAAPRTPRRVASSMYRPPSRMTREPMPADGVDDLWSGPP
jgi:single-stranded DNA-binding protein